MDDMNMNNEPPVYDSGDMKPTDPISTEGENDAGLTEELPMYEDTLTSDRGGRKKIIAIAAGVVLIAGLGIGAFALSSHKTANTQPAEQEQTVTPVKDNSEEKTDNLSTSDIAKLCSTLKLDDADLAIASDQVRVDAKSGHVLVTQVSEDDAAKMVDSTARRSAALAALLNGKKIKGVSAVDVTWVATDKDGNIKVAVTYDVTKAPTGGSTVDIINGSGGHMIADDIWSTDGVHDQGYDQNAGTVKKPDGTSISTGAKTEEKKESDGKGQKSDDSKKENNKSSDSSKSDNKGDSSQSKQNSGNSQSSSSNNSSNSNSGSVSAGWKTGVASAYGGSSDASTPNPGTTATGAICNDSSMGVAVPMSWPNYRSYLGRAVEIKYGGRTVIATVNDCGSMGGGSRALDLQPGVFKAFGFSTCQAWGVRTVSYRFL